MITKEELRDVRHSVARWMLDVVDLPDDPANWSNLIDDHFQLHPVHHLVLLRERGKFDLSRSPFGVPEMIFKTMTLHLQNVFAEAFFDWVVWLRDRGCTPGITRALLNGERDKILALIDAELAEEGGE